MKKNNFNTTFWGGLVSAIGVIITLVVLYIQYCVIHYYKYTDNVKDQLIAQARDSEKVKKLSPLKEKEIANEQFFTDCIYSLLGPEDNDFVSSIIKLSSSKHKHDWEIAVIIVVISIFTLFILILLYKSDFDKKNDLKSNELIKELTKENESLKKEVDSQKKFFQNQKEKNSQLQEKRKSTIDTLYWKNKELTEFKEDVCLCNVSGAYPALDDDSNWSIKKIKENAGEIQEFDLIGVFADKWIKNSERDSFEQFLEKIRLREKNRVRFLLTDPFDDENITDERNKIIKKSVQASLKEAGRFDSKKLIDFYRNYEWLLENTERCDNFQCKVINYFPFFRYRKINSKMVISDYNIKDSGERGSDRPHLLLKYDSQNCINEASERNKIDPCFLFDAFENFFKDCWNDSTAKDLKVYLSEKEDKFKQHVRKYNRQS